MENSKVYTIFAGINGAGKTTLYYALGRDNFGVRLNADETLRKSGADWKNFRAQLVAGKQVLELEKECFEKGLSMHRETTLGLSILNSAKKAKELGYTVNLYFVGINSLDDAKKRIAIRIERGGHGVDEDLIESRYRLLNKNIKNILPYCDNARFYDNSGKFARLVAYQNENEFIKFTNNCKWLNDLINEIIQEQNKNVNNNSSNESKQNNERDFS